MLPHLIALAVVASALFPSPVTLATFKPWKNPDPVVRKVFWASAIAGILLVLFIARAGGMRKASA